ncbi:forkhead box protein J1 [Caerostris extrusa]|uniref:Forkhead box protein J1 n=1 Tax=Caerostris extrusa TaxID=172846 RepID=A0AAV4XHB5_CAEEX|nr:forkhead box protein J1 [Caerostris extrusa]
MTFSMPMVSKDEMALRFSPELARPEHGGLAERRGRLPHRPQLAAEPQHHDQVRGTHPRTRPRQPTGSLSRLGQGQSVVPGGKGGHLCSSSSRAAPQAEDVDYKTNGAVKPPYSYATLICMAMKANENKMTLSAIYKWIKENFMYYRNADPSWQHTLEAVSALSPGNMESRSGPRVTVAASRRGGSLVSGRPISIRGNALSGEHRSVCGRGASIGRIDSGPVA